MPRTRRVISALPAAAVPWAIVAVCCGLPLAWLVTQLVTHPQIWHDAIPDAFRWRLIGRTFGYNALAATLATACAIPVALVLGGGSARWRWLWTLLPVPLLMPSLVLTYGWKQLFAQLGSDPMPQGVADVARCIVALASWVWPAPAMLIAFALRRLDPSLFLHARLDGATARIVARLLAGPALLGLLLAFLLSLQEFAVFEPTGISVIATEVRSVFETGASLDQRWSPQPQVAAADPVDADLVADELAPPQAQRSAAALAVMLPGLLGTLGLLVVGVLACRSLVGDADTAAPSDRVALRVPLALELIACLLCVVLVALPILAMATSLRTTFDPLRIANDYAPQLRGSLTLALFAAALGITCGVAASLRRPSGWLIGVALLAFLIGGQWVAIALINVFNRPFLLPLYDSAAMPVVAYVCRFVWVVLIASALTWSPGVRWLRELAATDGAGPWQTWRRVVLPITWPLLAGGVVLLFTLSLTEVPATTLLQPAQTLVPMLMTWAHILNYDAMMEASLLLVAVVMTAGVTATWLVRRVVRTW